MAGAVAATLGATVMGFATGTAQADEGRHVWCPGQSMEWPTGPWNRAIWDMNVCHTWYAVDYGMGNTIDRFGSPSNIWEGENPPPRVHRVCPPIAFMCP